MVELPQRPKDNPTMTGREIALLRIDYLKAMLKEVEEYLQTIEEGIQRMNDRDNPPKD